MTLSQPISHQLLPLQQRCGQIEQERDPPLSFSGSQIQTTRAEEDDEEDNEADDDEDEEDGEEDGVVSDWSPRVWPEEARSHLWFTCSC